MVANERVSIGIALDEFNVTIFCIDLLGSLAGDMGESGLSLGLLGGGGVFVMSCADCVAGFLCCVVGLVGEEDSRFGGI